MLNVDFELEEPQILCHKQYESLAPKILQGLIPYKLHNHFILFSSGTTGGNLKGYAVSKKALFANAKAFNEHFKLTQEDVWALSLPKYHIGGLSVLARTQILGNKLIETGPWNPSLWHQKIQDATITTIVPTQLYDLVKLNLKAPKNLKFLIVGGDFLSSSLKEEALKLGWPVIRTFGMSEICSQLAATLFPESEELKVMPIHEVKTDAESRLLVKSQSLFTLQFRVEEEINVTLASELCNSEGFYKTSDSAILKDDSLKHLGRLGDEFKIAGHLVNLNQLKDALSSYLLKNNLYGKMEFTIEDHDRKGKSLILLSLEDNQQSFLEISKLISPVKIDRIETVSQFERTSLGKLKSRSL